MSENSTKLATSHGEETANEMRLRIIQQLRETADRLERGCSDGYCRCRPRSQGMHTNGGCRCLDMAAYAVRWATKDLELAGRRGADCFPESRKQGAAV